MRRYYRGTAVAKRLVEAGVLGPVQEVRASEGISMHATGRDEGWYQGSPEAGGGVLLETGSHLVDQAFWVLGVSSFRAVTCRESGAAGMDVESSATSMIRLTDDREVELRVRVSWTTDLYSGVFIRFPAAVLRVGVGAQDPLVLSSLDGRTLASLKADGDAAHVDQAFGLEWRDFIAQCTTGRRWRVDANTALATTEFVEACYRSATEGKDRP